MSQPELDFSAGAAEGPGSSTGSDLQPEGTFTVSQLAELIRNRLRSGLDQGVWVRGEIQGWNGKGAHAYFTLADDKSETKSVISVACFAPQRDRLRPMLKKANLLLGDGMKVLIHGTLDFYAPTGRLTLKMDGLSPRYTLGDLAQQRDQVLRRLTAKGLHEANKRRPLSPIPLRVGVVTSVGTAAWHDFENELSRSGIGFELSVCDVRVQGDRAESMVVAAITTLARRPLDAIVVIRGGGARNELAVFDSEAIAVAIAASPHPVLTGLGHEIDRSIADEVAKASFKTPTACAHALVTAAQQYLVGAEQAFTAITTVAHDRIDAAEQALGAVAHRIARRTHAAVGRAEEGLDMRMASIRAGGRRHVAAAQRRIDDVAARIRQRPAQVLAAEQRHLDGLAARVSVLDPVTMMRRGWTITRSADGTILRSPDIVHDGDVITTQFATGRLTSTVTDHTPGRPNPEPDL
jgi:exodeoxyribonuclease VII large subunit